MAWMRLIDVARSEGTLQASAILEHKPSGSSGAIGKAASDQDVCVYCLWYG